MNPDQLFAALWEETQAHPKTVLKYMAGLTMTPAMKRAMDAAKARILADRQAAHEADPCTLAKGA